MATEQAVHPVPKPHRLAPRDGGTVQNRVLDVLGSCRALLTEQAVSLYAAAVLRIGYGLLYLSFLLREFPHRDEIWGPGSPWTPALATQLFDQTGWFSVLTLSDSHVYFEVCYAAALVTSALFLLGWRTRATAVAFAVLVASFHARALFMTDGGDNLILLMAWYLPFTACGRRWSLDARRVGLRTASGGIGGSGRIGGAGGAGGAGEGVRSAAGPRMPVLWRQLGTVREILTTVLHNCGMFVIAAQVCVLYGSAGFYKAQGGSWGNGTALHYVLNLDLFRPWPALSEFVDGHQMMVAVASYLTVLLQIAFPFVLFGRFKYIVLTMLLGMHLGIAVLMGLPLFSGAMIVADAAFLPDRFYVSAARMCRRAVPGSLSRRISSRAAASLVPPQPGSPA